MKKQPVISREAEQRRNSREIARLEKKLGFVHQRGHLIQTEDGSEPKIKK